MRVEAHKHKKSIHLLSFILAAYQKNSNPKPYRKNSNPKPYQIERKLKGLKKKKKKNIKCLCFLENHEFCNFQLQTWFPKTIVVAMRNSNMLLQTKQKVI